MDKFKITWERSRDGVIDKDWSKKETVEAYMKPKVGDGRCLLVIPPIYEYIIKVEELPDTCVSDFEKPEYCSQRVSHACKKCQDW